MTNSPKIHAIVQAFITELSAALADEGSAAIRAAFGAGEIPTPFVKRGPGRPPAAAKPGPKPKGRAKGAKRSPDELEGQTKALLAFVKKNPGQRIEAIGKAIGISTKDLALPVIKLKGEGLIKAKGQKRATTYTAK